MSKEVYAILVDISASLERIAEALEAIDSNLSAHR